MNENISHLKHAQPIRTVSTNKLKLVMTGKQLPRPCSSTPVHESCVFEKRSQARNDLKQNKKFP